MTRPLTPESEALPGRVWRIAYRMLRHESVPEDHAMAVADVIRFEVEKELPAIEAAAEGRALPLPTVEALADLLVKHFGASFIPLHIHPETFTADPRIAGNVAVKRARFLSRVSGFLQDLAATPAPAPEHGPEGNEGYCRCGEFVGHGRWRQHREYVALGRYLDAPAPEADRE